MKPYSKYTKSAIGWLDSFPSHWNVTFLKRFSDRITDGAHFSPPTVFEGRNYVSVKDIDEFGNIDLENCKKIDQNEFDNLVKNGCQPAVGDLLLTKDGTIGRAAVVNNNNFVVLSSLGIISPNEKLVFSYYLRYYLISKINYEQMMSLIAGAALTRLTIEKIKHLFITIPPYDEQTQIARYLDYQCTIIDDLINKKEQLIERLQELRQATINEAVTKGLDPKAKMKDSGVEWMGEIPKNWGICKLKYIVSMQSGSSITSENIESEGVYPVYGGNGLRGYTNNFTNDGEYILIGRQGALCGNINYARDKFWASEHAVVVYPKKEIDTYCIGELLRMMNLNQYSESAAQPGISVSKISNLWVPNIPIQEQRSISIYLKQKSNLFQKLESEIHIQIQKLKDYRQSLISEAVTGKFDVREWQPSSEN